MAKKKKTRKLKERSSLRNHRLSQSQDSVAIEPQERYKKPIGEKTTFQFIPDEISKTNAQQKASAATDYHFLQHDLRKTAILTTSIIIAQVALYFLIKNAL